MKRKDSKKQTSETAGKFAARAPTSSSLLWIVNSNFLQDGDSGLWRDPTASSCKSRRFVSSLTGLNNSAVKKYKYKCIQIVFCRKTGGRSQKFWKRRHFNRACCYSQAARAMTCRTCADVIQPCQAPYFFFNRAPRDRDTSLCLIGRRYEHVDKYFNDVWKLWKCFKAENTAFVFVRIPHIQMN